MTTGRFFEVRLFFGFRFADPRFPGDARRSLHSWRPYGRSSAPHRVGGSLRVRPANRPDTQIRESVEIDSRTGAARAAALEDGSWVLEIDPVEHEVSAGAAGAALGVDHGQGYFVREGRGYRHHDSPEVPPPPLFRPFQLEFRPLRIQVDVSGGRLVDARVMAGGAVESPPHAVLFWEGLGPGSASQALEISWKPDFLRRVVPRIAPSQWSRQRKRITAIEIHHTDSQTIGPTLNTFLPNRTKTSGSHFVVDLDGHVVRLVDDIYVCKHGGGNRNKRPASWRGARSVNSFTIGIEIVHPHVGDPSTPNPFTDAQYAALSRLLAGLQSAYGVQSRNVFGHQEAHCKVGCPGPHFDWTKLEDRGLALRPRALSEAELSSMFGGYFAGEDGRGRTIPIGATDKGGDGLALPDGTHIESLSAGPVAELAHALKVIGYAPELWIRFEAGGRQHRHVPGTFDRPLALCVTQFIRRFCSGSRRRDDLRSAYSELAPKDLAVDYGLAALIHGARLTNEAAREASNAGGG